MNRAEKERVKHRNEILKGKTPHEIHMFEMEERAQEALEVAVRKQHIADFPEEYDHMYDSCEDARDRRQGINPMKASYVAEVNARRVGYGLQPLAPNGMAVDGAASWELAKRQALLRNEISLTDNQDGEIGDE